MHREGGVGFDLKRARAEPKSALVECFKPTGPETETSGCDEKLADPQRLTCRDAGELVLM